MHQVLAVKRLVGTLSDDKKLTLIGYPTRKDCNQWTKPYLSQTQRNNVTKTCYKGNTVKQHVMYTNQSSHSEQFCPNNSQKAYKIHIEDVRMMDLM